MSKFYPPKVTTAIRTTNTPLKGELLFDTDLNMLFIGDGITVGGIEVGTGGGDMLKSTYDTNNDGTVNSAEVANQAIAIQGNPGTNQYYGTNESGVKGFYSLSTGVGDMYKAVYDQDNDGIVDLAEHINGSPGASQYYGTDETGTKGFYALPEGSGDSNISHNRIYATITAAITI